MAESKNVVAPSFRNSGMTSDNIDSMLLQMASRIDGILTEEAVALSNQSGDVIDQVISRKNHLALEVGRLERHVSGHVPSTQVKEKVAETLLGLSKNAAQIQRHIEAVEEMVEMLVDIHRRFASDGTYTADGKFGAKVK